MAITLQVDADSPLRRFFVKYPGDWLPLGPLPLIVVLHDEDSTAEEALESLDFAQFNSSSEAPPGEDGVTPLALHKVVVLYPEAFRPALGAAWNSGHYREGGALFNQDDVAFLHRAVDWVIERFNAARLEFTLRGSNPLQTPTPPSPDLPQIDPERIFVVGHGSGAAMAYRLIAEPIGSRSWVWRAAALVNGTAGGLRHARLLLDYGITGPVPSHPRMVHHEPGGSSPPRLSLFVLRGEADNSWASQVAPSFLDPSDPIAAAGGLSVSDRDALVANGVSLDQAERQARWDLSLQNSVDPWAAYLGIAPGWSPSPAPGVDLWWEGVSLSGGERVRVEQAWGRAHEWDPVYTLRVLQFFGTL